MNNEAEPSELDSLARLWELADYIVPFAVRAASALGIADRLADGPVCVNQLAEAAGLDPGALRRLLKALAGEGLFREVEADRFALTPASDLLRSDHPFSLRDAYLLPALEMRAWAAFDYCLRTGRSAFEHVHGQDHRSYRSQHAEEDARMDRAHRASTRIEVRAISRLYDWKKVSLVVDVGGGTGAFLAGLLVSFKQMRGVLFDLPRMVSGAGEILSAAGVADRCEVVGGDFFESVPAGGDVYVLKAVIGGWSDEAAVKILRTVRAAMRDDSRLLVIEPILQHGEHFTLGNVIHLQSLVLYGGPDRTPEDYGQLFAEAGLRITRVVQRATMPLIELEPV
jgi:DNA-binding transcriptional ArsR family regulator